VRLAAPGAARCRGLAHRLFDAIRQACQRQAAEEAERCLGLSGEKLTDEMERKMMERLMRNRSFRP
jgi:hypothetical protein